MIPIIVKCEMALHKDEKFACELPAIPRQGDFFVSEKRWKDGERLELVVDRCVWRWDGKLEVVLGRPIRSFNTPDAFFNWYAQLIKSGSD